MKAAHVRPRPLGSAWRNDRARTVYLSTQQPTRQRPRAQPVRTNQRQAPRPQQTTPELQRLPAQHQPGQTTRRDKSHPEAVTWARGRLARTCKSQPAGLGIWATMSGLADELIRIALK